MIDALCDIEFDSELPSVTGTDNGSVLTVVEGSWNKAAAPTELPAVTGDDNGKVLSVVEGAWAKAAASSGNNDFIVNYTTNDEIDYTCDKTVAEIYAAFQNGKNIVAMAHGYRFILSGADDEKMQYYFINPNDADTANSIQLMKLQHNANGNAFMTAYDIPLATS